MDPAPRPALASPAIGAAGGRASRLRDGDRAVRRWAPSPMSRRSVVVEGGGMFNPMPARGRGAGARGHDGAVGAAVPVAGDEDPWPELPRSPDRVDDCGA